MKVVSWDDQPTMQSLLTLLLQLSGKAWAALMVTVFCGGAVTAFYFSSANAGSNSTPGNPIVAVQSGHVEHPGGTLGGGHYNPPPPVVPEANPGLVLIPVVAAMLLVSARRLWAAKPILAADGQNAKGAPES
jgi:hypothetical protein